MKRARKFTAAAAFLLCLAGFALPRGAEAVRLTIDIPSVTETVLESGRDFYVAGRIDREGVPAAEMPLDIRIEVADAGEMRDGIRRPVRVVESRVGKSGVTEPRDILFDCAGIAPWVKLAREELAASPPPELVFRAEAPASFRDPRVKAAVTEERYAALVQGGATKECGGDYSKIYDTDLEWNYFRVTALALHEGRVVAEVYKDVMLGSVPDKILTRFSPPEHFAKASALARERGWRMYLDPFPGYWNAGLPRAVRDTCPLARERRAGIFLRLRPRRDLQYLGAQRLAERGARAHRLRRADVPQRRGALLRLRHRRTVAGIRRTRR